MLWALWGLAILFWLVFLLHSLGKDCAFNKAENYRYRGWALFWLLLLSLAWHPLCYYDRKDRENLTEWIDVHPIVRIDGRPYYNDDGKFIDLIKESNGNNFDGKTVVTIRHYGPSFLFFNTVRKVYE